MEVYTLELAENRHPVLVSEKQLSNERVRLCSAEAVAEIGEKYLRLSKKAEEHLYMFALDTRGLLLGIFEVFQGTVNESLACPREIYIRALLCGAVGIIVLHNHPSLEIMPSIEDFLMEKRLSEAGKILGVELLDFIIVGEGYYSFRETRRE